MIPVEAMLRKALRSRELAAEGVYCRCSEPLHSAPPDTLPIRGRIGLMCERCELRDNALAERMADYASGPHPFVELPRLPGWCEVCIRLEGDARHDEEAK